MREQLELVRDLLDTQLVDADETKMGRVDGIVLAIDDDGPPRIDHLELGFAVLARRVHPRVERWLQSLRRWSVRRSARQVVPWSSVADINQHHVKLDVKFLDTPAGDWERAARKVVSKMPGAGEEK
jgi:hypothetical protein